MGSSESANHPIDPLEAILPFQAQTLDMLQGSSIAHFVVNKQHSIIEWNKACEMLTGYPAAQMLGTKDQWKPFYSDERPCIVDLLLVGASEEMIRQQYKDMDIKKWELADGAYEVEGFFAPLGQQGKWLRFTAAPLRDGNGEVIAAVETLEDITQRKVAEQEREKLYHELLLTNKRLKHLALRDPHTGLFNHRYLSEIMEAELIRSRRYEQPLSLIMVDIDYFKSINDVYGHEYGDLVLKQVARQLRKIVRRYDMVVRWGGEEFVIVSPGIDKFQTLMLGQRILDDISLYDFGDKRQSVKLKLSIAVVSYPEEKVAKAEDLLELAEQIINKAKEDGGNRLYSSYNIKRAVRKKPSSVRKRSPSEQQEVSLLKNQLGKLTRRANQSLIEAIFAFAKTIEIKDHYTGEHVERTVYYATQIARALKFDPEEVENVKQAAILHDLGKVGISDNILLKNAKLTDDEYREIKRHPQIAADILRPIRFMHSIIPYILYHHERWDGCGYPSGLKGDLIPVGARIIAIADVFQALISNRPYRKAFSREEAVKILKAGSGSQFDPRIVKVFLQILKKAR